MQQPAVPIQPAQIGRHATYDESGLPSPRIVVRGVKGHLLRLLRKLGDFVAAGGALS
jgi:hypothetical protein